MMGKRRLNFHHNNLIFKTKKSYFYATILLKIEKHKIYFIQQLRRKSYLFYTEKNKSYQLLKNKFYIVSLIQIKMCWKCSDDVRERTVYVVELNLCFFYKFIYFFN